MDSVPPTPSPVPPKKATSTLAIVAFGCGGLLVLFVIVSFIVLRTCTMYVKGTLDDFQKNPGKAAAMLVIKTNPDLEVLKTDDATGEVTIRDKKSGDVMTMSFNDISQGKFKMKDSKGGEMVVDATNKDGKGNIVMSNKDGTTVIGGDQAATAPPAWVPIYPGTQVKTGGMRTEKADTIQGLTIAETPDAPAKVREFYESKLKEAGYQTEISSYNAADTQATTVTATKDDGKSKINVVVTLEKGKTTIMINYEGPKS